MLEVNLSGNARRIACSSLNNTVKLKDSVTWSLKLSMLKRTRWSGCSFLFSRGFHPGALLGRCVSLLLCLVSPHVASPPMWENRVAQQACSAVRLWVGCVLSVGVTKQVVQKTKSLIHWMGLSAVCIKHGSHCRCRICCYCCTENLRWKKTLFPHVI